MAVHYALSGRVEHDANDSLGEDGNRGVSERWVIMYDNHFSARESRGFLVERRSARLGKIGYKEGPSVFFDLLPPFCLCGDELHVILLGFDKDLLRGESQRVFSKWNNPNQASSNRRTFSMWVLNMWSIFWIFELPYPNHSEQLNHTLRLLLFEGTIFSWSDLHLLPNITELFLGTADDYSTRMREEVHRSIVFSLHTCSFLSSVHTRNQKQVWA